MALCRKFLSILDNKIVRFSYFATSLIMSNSKHWFSQLARMRLFNLSWQLLIFLYCAIILIFACIYTSIPNDFSHLNLVKETAYSDIQKKVENTLSLTIKDMLSYEIKQFTEDDTKPFKYDLTTLSDSQREMILFAKQINVKRVDFIKDIEMEDHGYYVSLNLTADIFFEAPNIERAGTYSGFFTSEISVQYPMELSRKDKDIFFKILLNHRHRTFLYDVSEPATPMAYEYLVMVLKEIGTTKSQDHISDISMLLLNSNIPSEERSKHINDLIMLSRGIPVGTYFCLFKRMLYLSMITITTLGYGDIVPLTDLSRLLVGLEATLGVICLGLIIAIFSNLLGGNKGDSVTEQGV